MPGEVQTMTVTGVGYIPVLAISVDPGDVVSYHENDEGKVILNKVEKPETKKTKKEEK